MSRDSGRSWPPSAADAHVRRTFGVPSVTGVGCRPRGATTHLAGRSPHRDAAGRDTRRAARRSGVRRRRFPAPDSSRRVSGGLVPQVDEAFNGGPSSMTAGFVSGEGLCHARGSVGGSSRSEPRKLEQDESLMTVPPGSGRRRLSAATCPAKAVTVIIPVCRKQRRARISTCSPNYRFGPQCIQCPPWIGGKGRRRERARSPGPLRHRASTEM
jgi:hypothetical protein